MKLLTIGGSDSGGAAGIQADLKTWTRLRVYGMSAMTAVTAQNSEVIADVAWMSAAFVRAQVETVLSDYGADAVKTGLLGRVEIIEAIAPILQTIPHVVIDPVLLRHTGDLLFDDTDNLINAYRMGLFPAATLITPNWREAALLTGKSADAITSISALEAMAHTLHQMGAPRIVITGWRTDDGMLDLFYDGDTMHHFNHLYIETENTHGSGDTFSAAIVYWLAQGRSVRDAVNHAHQFTVHAITMAADWQLCAGHGPLAH